MKPASTLPEFTELWAAYRKTRSDAARNALAEKYLKWVKSIAQRIAEKLPDEVQLDDLIQWGNEGLLEAMPKFNPARGFKFTTFAHRIIPGRIYDGLRNNAQRSRVTMERTKKLNDAENMLCNELGRNPTPEETAERLGITHKQYRKQVAMRQIHDRSLETEIICDGPHVLTLGGAIQDTHNQGDEMEVREQVEQIIGFVLENYQVADALILRLHYLDELPMQEVAKMMKVCPSRISQRHAIMLRVLKAQFREAA